MRLSWAARPSRHRKNSRRRGGTSLHAVISHAQRHRHYAPFLRCADSPKVQSTFPASDPARRSALDCDVPWSRKPGVRTITPLYNSPPILTPLLLSVGVECPTFKKPYLSSVNSIRSTKTLTLSPPILLRLYTLPYWSNPPFLIFDIRALWRSVLSASAPECQKLKMVG